MTKKNLFEATKNEVVTTAPAKLFNKKLEQLQKIRDKNRKANDELKPKISIQELAKQYSRLTNSFIHEDTMSDILHDKPAISRQKLSDIRKFLGELCPDEPFYLMFEDDQHVFQYEHDLFFEILKEANEQIIKFLPKHFYGFANNLNPLELALSDWGTKRIDTITKEMIWECWKQVVILLPEAQLVYPLVKLNDVDPIKYSNELIAPMYDYMFLMIENLYKDIFKYDLAPAFPHNCFRFQTYNQLSNLNRKHIQDHAIYNLYMLVMNLTEVMYLIRNLNVNLAFQWSDIKGKKILLESFSKFNKSNFVNVTNKLGNDYKFNVFK